MSEPLPFVVTRDLFSVMNPRVLNNLITEIERELRAYAASRASSVKRGLESRELSALLAGKYTDGIRLALEAIGVKNNISKLGDELATEIDPNFAKTRQRRYQSFASLQFTPRAAEVE